MDFLVRLSVLVVVLGFVKTELPPKEFVLGGTLTLKPEGSPSPITSITWKHQGNLVMEQSETFGPDYYDQFNGRTNSDFKTGELTIVNLTKEDAGNYHVEINENDRIKYKVNIIKAVPVPSVASKQLVCSKNSEACWLHCEGNVDDAGTVLYFWKGDGDWKESTMKNYVKNDENTRKIKEFMCKVKNSVSEEESAAFPNPFYEETSSINAAAIIVPVIIGVLVVVLVGVVYKKKKLCFKNCRKENDTTNSNGTNNAEEMERLAESNSPAADTN